MCVVTATSPQKHQLGVLGGKVALASLTANRGSHPAAVLFPDHSHPGVSILGFECQG